MTMKSDAADPTTVYLLAVFDRLTAVLRQRVESGTRAPVDDATRTQLRKALFKINEVLVEIPERWACRTFDENEPAYVAPTITEVLERCRHGGLRRVELHRCQVALPCSVHIDTDAFVELLNDALCNAAARETHGDFSDNFCEGPQLEATPAALADLNARLTMIVRWWAQSHGCHEADATSAVRIHNWEFIGEPRTFVFVPDDPSYDPAFGTVPAKGTWRETAEVGTDPAMAELPEVFS